jgi:type I restriction enzyme S subunit
MKSVDPAWREVSFSEVRAFKSGGAKFLPKDTLMARITPCLENGKIARYMPSGRNGEAFGSTEFIVIRGKRGVTDNDFAYYLTMWPEFREFAISQMTGSSGRQRVPVDSLAGFNFNLPPLTEQKAIAHILGSLDDKIELNRRMNETLEAMAQALFKSWFVDFDPVIDNAFAAGNDIPEELKERGDIRETLGDARKPLPAEIQNLFPSEFEHTEEMGWIPKGWTTQPLYEIANFINGAAYKNFHFTDELGALPVVKIAEIKNGVSAQTKFTKTELADKYRIDDGDILFSWSGNPDTSIDTFVWTGGPGWLNQHIFNVSLNDDADRNFVYYQLKLLRPDFAEIARNKQTTGLGHVTAQDMKRLHVTKCPSSILQAFNTYAGSLFDRWYSNLLAIKNTSKLRDTLLPQLLSGEMRIPEAEKLVEDLERNGGSNGKS